MLKGNKESCLSYITKNIKRRQSNKVLHGFPSPFLWRKDHSSISEMLKCEYKAEEINKKPRRLNLYLSFPFCIKTNPEKCGYCLFPSENYSKHHSIDQYFEYVRKEGRMFAEYMRNRKPASIYFGGGTPNILKPKYYSKLMDIVREIFPVIPKNIEITLEGTSNLFNEEKLSAIKEAGMNRVSFGVQQMNDSLIKLSGRHQKISRVFELLEFCRNLKLKTSIDLIYGWPKQTLKTHSDDLKAIAEHDIQHLTMYELNVGNAFYPTHFSTVLKNDLPSIEKNLEMYRMTKSYLENNGYEQDSCHDWKKKNKDINNDYIFEQNMRNLFEADEYGNLVRGSDMWGWGFAGVSFFLRYLKSPGVGYMNHINLKDYYDSLDKNQYPIFLGYEYKNKVDLFIASIVQSLQSMEVDCLKLNSIFQADVIKDFEAAWEVFSDREWIDISGDKIKVVGDGGYFIPLMQGLIGSERTQHIKNSY